jgi:hypothetical protein
VTTGSASRTCSTTPLKTSTHPEVLVRRSDGRKEFDNILLIAPGEASATSTSQNWTTLGVVFWAYGFGGFHILASYPPPHLDSPFTRSWSQDSN